MTLLNIFPQSSRKTLPPSFCFPWPSWWACFRCRFQILASLQQFQAFNNGVKNAILPRRRFAEKALLWRLNNTVDASPALQLISVCLHTLGDSKKNATRTDQPIESSLGSIFTSQKSSTSTGKSMGKRVELQGKLLWSRWTHAEPTGTVQKTETGACPAWLEHLKCPKSGCNCRFRNYGVSEQTLDSWVAGTFFLLGSRWIHAPFVGGMRTYKRSVGWGVQIAWKCLFTFLPHQMTLSCSQKYFF